MIERKMLCAGCKIPVELVGGYKLPNDVSGLAGQIAEARKRVEDAKRAAKLPYDQPASSPIPSGELRIEVYECPNCGRLELYRSQ
ncbi:MAG TPA: hypothetical protein VF749_17300 [Candidatus Acidoferrum sp.]